MYLRRQHQFPRHEARVNNRKRGFTLVEIVVSAALIAVVLSTLIFGMRLLVNLWKRIQAETENQTSRTAVTETLRSQLAAIEPDTTTTGGFEGDVTHVRFTTRYSTAGRRSPGLWSVTATVRESEAKGNVLVIAERPMISSLAAKEEESGETLVGIEADRIELSYLSPESAAGPAAWVSEWHSEVLKQIPLAVRVHSWRGQQEEISTFPIPVQSRER